MDTQKYYTLPDDTLVLVTVTVPLSWCRLNMQRCDICHSALRYKSGALQCPSITAYILTYTNISLFEHPNFRTYIVIPEY